METVYETKKPPVNDGGGLYDNVGLIDTIIVDCNDMVNLLFAGKSIQFCSRVVQLIQKLSNLRNGVKNDTESMQRQIDDLRKLLDSGVQ